MKNIKFWDLRAAACGIWASLTRHGGVVRLREKHMWPVTPSEK
jgi:hypothetical protein